MDKLTNREIKVTKFFLLLSYLVYFSYEILYVIAYPIIKNQKFIQTDLHLRIWAYMLLLIVLVYCLTLIKRNQYQNVKYIFFYSYIVTSTLFDIFLSPGSNPGGNIIEIVIILFTPMFMSKTFFWTASLGTILKFSILGLALADPSVLIPIILVVAFSIVSYILLKVFTETFVAVKDSYQGELTAFVKGVNSALELKDPYTKGHSERVAEYSRVLAEKMGLSEEILHKLYYSCLLHDVGKINTPDSILTKPDALTKEEFEIVKIHPIIGYQVVRDMDGIEPDIIKSHHERWDGKGYPDQLAGESIPFLARIVAVADAFDAMTSNRTYRLAISSNEAYNRIDSSAGTQFDPDIIKHFKEVYPQWVNILKKKNR